MSDAVMVPRELLIRARHIVGDRAAGGRMVTSREEASRVWNDLLSAALAASPPVGGWEDISTAPKDGKHFLAVDECGDASRCAYHSEGYLMSFCGQPVVQPFEPVLWMPWPDTASPQPADGCSSNEGAGE